MTASTIACPHCLAKNRVPSERLGDGPVCGKCKKRLFSGKPTELTAANVTSILNHTDIPVLVDCWAPWCGPCRNFAPVFEQASSQFEPHLRLAKLNTEAHQQVATRWQIRSIPTLILFRQGREVARMSGAIALPQLTQWLRQQGVL